MPWWSCDVLCVRAKGGVEGKRSDVLVRGSFVTTVRARAHLRHRRLWQKDAPDALSGSDNLLDKDAIEQGNETLGHDVCVRWFSLDEKTAQVILSVFSMLSSSKQFHSGSEGQEDVDPSVVVRRALIRPNPTQQQTPSQKTHPRKVRVLVQSNSQTVTVRVQYRYESTRGTQQVRNITA